MYRSITPQVSMPQHSIFGEAVTVTSATSIKKQKQTNPAKAAANNNNNNSNSNSAPKRSEKMAQPKRITSPLFNMAETAANAIFTYDELEPSEEAKKKSEAALAALIDLAVDHWKSKHRQASTAFDKQVNDYLRATESACNDACRRAEERCTSAIQAVAGQFGSDKDGAKEGPRSPDEKAASASSGVIAKEREHLDRVRQLLVDGVCSTMTDCAAMLAESTSIELEAQMRVHFRDRRKLLRADRRALVRKYRAKLAEHEAHEGTTIQTETTLQLIGQLALL